ncbi:MAG: family 16 glycosylhydrolase [Ignavibacteria bacterium]|nr:family 16 glycosylhydrolase [Ignavibacteria bacterium]
MKRIVVILVATVVLCSSAVFAKKYKGGELITKEAYLYGRFETRCKPPQGSGFLATLFTFNFALKSSEEWNEIAFDFLGRYDHDVQVLTIGPGQNLRNGHPWVDFIKSDDFHDYAFEWTPNYIAWFIDGVEVYRQAQAHIAGFKYSQKIGMDIWQPSYITWSGLFDDRVLPVFAYYDWVSYAAYTPGTGNKGTDNNFTMQWKDEFDSWDQNRWEKFSGTFDGNNCDFIPENVVFKDGAMILCLTKESPIGSNDQSPPTVLWTRALGNTIQLGFSKDVETVSAENESNYISSGLTVTNAVLLADHRTVMLTVSDLNPAANYNMIVLHIKDNSINHNMMAGQVLTVAATKPLTFPLRINVGGKAFDNYLGDQLWSPNLEYGHMDGNATQWPASVDIQGVDNDTVYLSELNDVVEYRMRVPNGTYRVTLMIAENKFKQTNARIFDIFVEGRAVVTNLDLVTSVGAQTAYQIIADNVKVADEMIDIHLNNRWSVSLLNGIVVEQLSTSVNEGCSDARATQFQMQQNHPNPFNPETTISYSIPASLNPSKGGTLVSLKVFDLLGREVTTLVDEHKQPGTYNSTFNALRSSLVSGVYFYKLQAGNFVETKKMLLVK